MAPVLVARPVLLALCVAACGGGLGGAAPDGGQGLDSGLDSGPRAGGEGGAQTDAGAGLDAGDVDFDGSERERCAPEDRERDIWVWGSSAATDLDEREDLLAFGRAHELRAYYVEAESLIEEDPDALAALIDAASAECREIELLFGRAGWALDERHEEALDLARRAAGFASALQGERPAGLHFDVEPYTLDEWDADPERTANEYLDLLEGLAEVAGEAGLRLAVDMPFWFDGREVERDGSTRPLSELVQDRVDRVVLMDYRDSADGDDGIIANAAAEIDYAGDTGHEVVIGVETICGLEPETITFCEEGAAALDDALATTRAAFNGRPAFLGFAVHHWGSYRDLAP
ncbi:MAG: hypothetical protein HYY06_11485 [Deltaproteobacteria bacterium]|nr:hypothetical protein [Deltaproteobacteria bacterium]